MARIITDEQVSEWRRNGAQYQQVAAYLAIWASDKPAGTLVPDDAAVMGDVDVIVTTASIARAKQLLATVGVLHQNGDDWHVA
jgi:hypothetical protein